jgi:hypothetical protein
VLQVWPDGPLQLGPVPAPRLPTLPRRLPDVPWRVPPPG